MIIDLEKAFGKTWINAVFYNLQKKGINMKIWRVTGPILEK